jgi:hypothetical protein
MTRFNLADAQNVHELLLGIFCSETGLLNFEPTTNATQLDAIINSFDKLKNNLLSWSSEASKIRFLADLPSSHDHYRVNYTNDSMLFVKLYGRLNGAMSLVGGEPTIVSVIAYPLVDEMLKNDARLRQLLSHVAQSYMTDLGPDARLKLRSTSLSEFGVMIHG